MKEKRRKIYWVNKKPWTIRGLFSLLFKNHTPGLMDSREMIGMFPMKTIWTWRYGYLTETPINVIKIESSDWVHVLSPLSKEGRVRLLVLMVENRDTSYDLPSSEEDWICYRNISGNVTMANMKDLKFIHLANGMPVFMAAPQWHGLTNLEQFKKQWK